MNVYRYTINHIGDVNPIIIRAPNRVETDNHWVVVYTKVGKDFNIIRIPRERILYVRREIVLPGDKKVG
jgi:hypothetical protein